MTTYSLYKRDRFPNKLFINIQGVDYGCDVEVLMVHSKAILCRVKGHMWRQSLGHQVYAKPRIIILDKIKPFQLKGIVTDSMKEAEYTRSNRREVLRLMIDRFKKMEE